jgi:DNA-binding response OmpR family regulator
MTDSVHAHRVLVVDDDTALLGAIELAFNEAGEDVLAHATFEGARRALRDSSFDALVTDVRLGAFNGLQLAVIARDAHPEIRVIVFSGFEDAVLRHDAESIGATYLVKPVSFSALLNIVRQTGSDGTDGSSVS